MSALATRGDRVPRLLLLGAIVLGGLAFEVVVGAAVVKTQFVPIAMLVTGGVVFALIAAFPVAALGVFVVLTASVLSGTRAVHIGPVGVRAHELLLIALLVVAVIRPRRRDWGGVAGLALAVFLGLVVLSAALAVTANKTDVSSALSWSRPFFLLAVFWAVLRLVPDELTARRMLFFAGAVGAATALLAVLIALGSPVVKGISYPGDTYVRSEGGLGGIKRVRLPGLNFSYVLFWVAVVQTYRSDRRVWWTIFALLALLDILVSFNRNMWLGLILGLGVMLLVGGVEARRWVVSGLAAGLGTVAILLLLAAPVSHSPKVKPLISRGGTLLNPQAVQQESSLASRRSETTFATRSIRAHPAFGVGAGVDYGASFSQLQSDGRYKRVPQLFLHNQYLYLMLVGGVGALVAFLVFLGSSLWWAWSARDEPVVVAALVGLLMLMFSATVSIVFSTEGSTVAIGLVAGLIGVLTATRLAAD